MSDRPAFDAPTLIAKELDIPKAKVEAVVRLLADGNTVPFIARYRKEVTGSLDETQIRAVDERHKYMVELDKRRQAILESIEEQGKLTDELKKQIESAATKAELADLYLPYKPKRRTRAAIAREKGLEPLAQRIMEQPETGDPVEEARAFINLEKDIKDAEAALKGARDIVAEVIAENADVRSMSRKRFASSGVLFSQLAKRESDEQKKYQDYYDYSESVKKIPSHRYLAVCRGEREGALKHGISIDHEDLLNRILARVGYKEGSPFGEELKTAAADGYKRLISPAVENDVMGDLKTEADRAAVEVFASNLRSLLLAAPFGGKPVIGVDPGLRTGCKCAAVDATGKFLSNMTFNLVKGDESVNKAKSDLISFVNRHRPAALAVGNGTGGREAEKFVKESLLKSGLKDVIVVQVSESGASVYSASELAGKEFPDLDLTVRGAISIARRLQDPLSELVKIEPKSIGVGQYQHDVHQLLLVRKLDEVVESAVNAVGVELNTASAELLSRVAGVGPRLAKNIVGHREANGAFKTRKELLKVMKLGPKAFEQAAGFLRVRSGEQPLDSSAVHPERYELVAKIAVDMGIELAELVGNSKLVDRIEILRYVSDEVGEPTLKDILAELKKPGRDPRDEFSPPAFRDDVQTMEDIKDGMELEGVVTNVAAFGAFVDIGVHQDGLVHISELADRFVKDPAEVVKVGDKINVRVLSVDLERKRISLSAKSGKPKQKEQKTDLGPYSRPNFSYNPFADLLKK
jgi:uncharacterized protein